MTYLLLGLILFLGTHSVRIVADGWRTRVRLQVGELAYKGIYSLLSLLGFALIVMGIAGARQAPEIFWLPPQGLRHAASLLSIIAFVLLAAAYVPRNGIKARVHHPMVLAVVFWALAHLLSSGRLVPMVLFAAFLLWSLLCFVAACRRDQADGIRYPAGTLAGTLVTMLVGVVLGLLFAMWLHGVVIGVRPFG
jgi:uncharacterized membrane protein